jgi:hypothetical protein
MQLSIVLIPQDIYIYVIIRESCGDLPLKCRNSRTLDKHVLSTLVLKLRWLRHLQHKNVSGINCSLNILQFKLIKKKKKN